MAARVRALSLDDESVYSESPDESEVSGDKETLTRGSEWWEDELLSASQLSASQNQREDDQVETYELGDEADGQSIPSATSEDRSVFTSDVAETMDLLREACMSVDGADLALRSFEMVNRICKSRFYAKSRLSSSGAADHLAILFNRWKDDPVIVVIACETLCQFAGGETENKIVLGTLNVCENLVSALDSMRTDLAVVTACCHAMCDLSNSILRSLLKKFIKPRAPPKGLRITFDSTFVAAPAAPAPELDEDFMFSDNRLRFGAAGACELLANIMLDLTSGDEALNEDNIIATNAVCQTVGTLAANQENCIALGRAGTCKAVVRILMDRFPISRSIGALWVIIVLCSDVKSGNKERFNTSVRPVIDFLYDIERAGRDYERDPKFDKLVEHLGWALLNLVVGCENNRKTVFSISYSKQAIAAVLGLDSIREAYKGKLRQAERRLYSHEEKK